ncbi:hypothetical protein ANO14919_069940 [Xylariales sp. No.14919]|nr:hypothetical protein ANO14919_069940 [Xylariales sp. No.14919]
MRHFVSRRIRLQASIHSETSQIGRGDISSHTAAELSEPTDHDRPATNNTKPAKAENPLRKARPKYSRAVLPSGVSPIVSSRLFLVGLGLGLVLGPLLPHTRQSRVASRLAESDVGTALDGCGDVALLDLGDTLADRDDRQRSADIRDGLGAAEVDVLAVAGLGVLGTLAGEDDQALLVGLKTGDIGGEGLLAEVLATEVDSDTDGGGHEAGNAGLL